MTRPDPPRSHVRRGDAPGAAAPPPACSRPAAQQWPPARERAPFGIPSDRPEALVGAAFAGGLVVALILKRFEAG